MKSYHPYPGQSSSGDQQWSMGSFKVSYRLDTKILKWIFLLFFQKSFACLLVENHTLVPYFYCAGFRNYFICLKMLNLVLTKKKVSQKRQFSFVTLYRYLPISWLKAQVKILKKKDCPFNEISGLAILFSRVYSPTTWLINLISHYYVIR